MELTADQKKYLDRVQAYIHSHGLISVMNNTKWRRMIEALHALPVVAPCRRKDVRDAGPSKSWDSDYYHVLGGWYVSIEWVEIQTKIKVHQGELATPRFNDNRSLIEDALREVKVPFVRGDDCVRVYGYVRPDDSPAWVE